MVNIFRFKQFAVDQSGCAMKINTDGVLLGALAAADRPGTILDIGTGTGVIALMLAQRFAHARVDAVEIDQSAAQTAKANFSNSIFADRLSLYAMGFEVFFKVNAGKRYDLIVANPPFYLHALESPTELKTVAKHADEAFFERLIAAVAAHLNADGTCWLILPLPTAQIVKHQAAQKGLFIKGIISIHSFAHSAAHREIVILSATERDYYDQRFVIYNAPKVYSAHYIAALEEFFTIF